MSNLKPFFQSSPNSLKFSNDVDYISVNNHCSIFFHWFPLHFLINNVCKIKVSAVCTLWKSFLDRETKETICLLRQ